MKIYRLLLPLLLGMPCFGQTHTFPALDTNNAFTGTNSFAGPTTFTNTITGTGSNNFIWAGPFTLSSTFAESQAGVFTNVANTSTGQVLIGGLTQTQINNLLIRNFNSSFFFTDGWEMGMTVGSGATVSQANTYNTFLVNRSTTTNAVGYFSVAAAGVAGAKIWPGNFIASDFDDTGTSFASTIIGLENDINCNNTGSTCVGYTATGGSNAASLVSSTAYLVGILGPSIKWQQGILIKDRATNNGIAMGAQNATGTPSSYGQALLITSYNSGGAAQQSFMRAYPAGGLELGSSATSNPTLFDQGLEITRTAAPTAFSTNDALLWFDSGDNFGKYNSFNQGEQHLQQTILLTSQYTNSTTGFTNVAGGNTLQWTVNANQKYTAECHLYYQAAATGGLNIESTGPASPTAVIYGLNAPLSVSTFNNSVATGFSSSLGTAVTTATTNFDALVSFSLINGANAGTVNLLAKSSAAAQLQIQAGSYCQIQ